MGWAKYTEDDIEIMLDRQYMRQREAIISVAQKLNIVPSSKSVVDVDNKTNASTVLNATTGWGSRHIQCKECGRIFCFTIKAQKQYERMGWSKPIRCKSCRELRKMKFLMCS